MRFLCGALLFLGVADSAMAQGAAANPANADSVIRVTVRQVLVPVIVTDKKGRSVGGLTPSDFQIAEDGVAQEIVAFTREVAQRGGGTSASLGSASSAPNATGGPAIATAAPKHIWIICLDALHTSSADFVRARDAIGKSLGSLDHIGGPSAGDQFVLLSIGRQLHVLQPATNDPSLIRAKVNGKAFTSLPIESNSAQLATAVNDVRRQMDIYCAKCPCGRGASNRQSTCALEVQRIKQGLDARSEQFREYDNGFFAQFNSVIAELAKLDGRRSLILISDGFTLTPGRELLAAAGAYLPNSPYFTPGPAVNMQSALDRSLKIAAAENIMVSVIDSRGNYTPGARQGGLMDASTAAPGSTGRQEVLTSRNAAGNTMRGGTLLEDADSKWSSVEFDNGSALAQLASATGGVYFHDSNDLQKGLHEALDDSRETYVLAYVPKNITQDGKFRQITVKVNLGNAKGETVVIRAKAGYWAENAADHQ
jgi:VWFA-related protein